MGADNNRIVTSILFLIYLLIPLFGGKLSLKALAVYATWAGSALLIRKAAKKQQKGIKIQKKEFILLSIYGVVCGIVWFSFPYSILFGTMMTMGTVLSYRAQLKRLANEENKKAPEKRIRYGRVEGYGSRLPDNRSFPPESNCRDHQGFLRCPCRLHVSAKNLYT
jgi:hypothetical protein